MFSLGRFKKTQALHRQIENITGKTEAERQKELGLKRYRKIQNALEELKSSLEEII